MRAHPRVCGENQGESSAAKVHAGSSPRVRGKLPAESVDIVAEGLIPACAGKTRMALLDLVR